jgi:hypothetical protein
MLRSTSPAYLTSIGGQHGCRPAASLAMLLNLKLKPQLLQRELLIIEQ